MKKENILLLGVLAFAGYLVYRKYSKPKATIVKPETIEEPTNVPEEKKTIVLNMRETRSDRMRRFVDPFYKDYNTSKFRTVAPPMVTIQPMS
jgi:hypothetical protein